MDSLISVVNKLQDAFNSAGMESSKAIQLPQIVVVGSQSVGKSSILESLVGHSILPRGTGMVTRCPIILQLIPLKDGDEALQQVYDNEGKEEWCEILSQPDKIYTDFDVARSEIEKETIRLIGNNKNIANKPITVKIFSKKVLHLTVVDLPGSVKVPTGNQPGNIEQQIQNLIITYIENPASIILAVCQGNADIVTSESLKLAEMVDRQGERTLVVVTKFDLVEDTTIGHEILTGQVLPAKLGIIGVVNRSQHDLSSGLSIEEGLKKENYFFKKNYPNFQDRTGSEYLAQTLSKILMSHIEKCLIPLETRIQNLKMENEKRIQQLGKSIDNANYFNIVTKVVSKFSDEYKSSIQSTPRNIDNTTFAVSGKIRDETSTNLRDYLDKIDPVQNMTDEIILRTMSHTRGAENSTANYENTFIDLVKREIPKLYDPSLTCARQVNKLLSENVEIILNLPQIKSLHERFPNLAKSIFKESKKFLNEHFDISNKMIESYVAVQSILVVINDEAIINKISEVKHLEGQLQMRNINHKTPGTPAKPFSEAEAKKIQCQAIRELIKIYFDIVRRAFNEYIPKALFHSMIYKMSDNIQNHLLGLFHKTEMLELLLQESDSIVKDREDSEETQKALEEATKIIAEVQGKSFYKSE